MIKIIGLDEKQKQAYGIVHNKLTMNTTFDYSKLDHLLDQLKNDFDLTDFGFVLNEEIDFESMLIDNYERPEGEENKKIKKCPHCGEII